MGKNSLPFLAQAAAGLGIILTERQADLFARYHQELTLWNEKINLFSRSSAGETLLKNFLDSLAAVPFLPPQGSAVLDMGSGGGFPGIPLKIARDNLKVTLLEASRRKASFLKHAIRTLSLAETSVIHDRAENLQGSDSYRNMFDVVISQAAFKLPQFLTLGAFPLAPEGVLIAMKGAHASEELEEAMPVAAASGLYLSASHSFVLPITGDQRTILIFKKT